MTCHMVGQCYHLPLLMRPDHLYVHDLHYVWDHNEVARPHTQQLQITTPLMLD